MDVGSVKRIHQEDWVNEGIRFLRARDIVAIDNHEIIPDEDKLYITKKKYDEYSSISGKVNIGDLLVTGVGTIGVPLLISTLKPVYFKDGNIIWFKNATRIDGQFLLMSFKAKTIQKHIKDAAGIGTVGTYTIDSGKKTPIYLPSQSEQIKIGRLFKNLDDLITLHQRKFFNWLLKFELNLIGLFYSWEQRKLSDSVTYRNGKAHESYIAKDGKYIVVNSKFVSTSGDVEKFSNIQIEPLYKGEIAFVLSDVPNGRALARTYLIENNDKYTLNQRIAGLTPNYEMDNYFLHILLNRNSYFLSFDDGAKQTNLSISDVLNFEFKAPSKNEQNKIGNLFKDLDSLITLHQR